MTVAIEVARTAHRVIADYMAVKRGDQLKLTHVPGVGFHGVLVGGNGCQPG